MAGAPASPPVSPAASAASAPPVANAAPAPAAGASAPRAAPAATVPGTPPSFASVIKDAQRIDGPIPVWRKAEKLWIELAPERFGQPLLLSPKLKSGIGEAGVFGGLMAFSIDGAGGAQLVEFRRVYDRVQLLARNVDVLALAGTPRGHAVQAGFSPSLLGSAAVASQPHPDGGAVLIEAGGLFLSDLLGLGMRLQRGFRQGYALDLRNSSIDAVRATPQATVIETRQHFQTASLAVPQAGAPAGAPVPSIPGYLPDARSLFIQVHYSLAPLPVQPMAARRADPRIGLFSNTVLDFGNDLATSPRKRVISRWRLEKKDPAAALSEPLQPITFWIDRSVPLEYRGPIREGILEWNKAFEAIGFKNAIEVREQAEDAEFDTLDFGVASVRWMVNPRPLFGAVGPSHIDPRSGEILDADIAIESLSSRTMRLLRSQILRPDAAGLDAGGAYGAEGFSDDARGRQNPAICAYGDVAAEQLHYAIDVLDARGEIDPEGERTTAFVNDYLKATVLHEVGHALGLRHNFRASRAYTEAQLADPDFTREHGTTGSVMEYQGINLSRPGEPAGAPFQTALGPYDYWAIEYAYKPVPAGDEEAELQRIAARNSEPLLAFGTDEDNALGIDPETLQLDLGDDPIAFARKRLDIAGDLFARQERRRLEPGQDWSVLRRSIGYAIADLRRTVGVLMRQIGGVRTLRDFPGSGRDPFEPVPAARQRQALDLIARSVLSTQALRVSPALQRRLAPDYLDRGEIPGIATEYSVADRLLELQRATLAQLMSDALAERVLDGENKVDSPAQAFGLSELYARLTREVWAELGAGRDVALARRELQREYVNRVAAMLLRPAPQSRADARSLLRREARALVTRLRTATGRRGLSPLVQAHLSDSAQTLQRALDASLQRAGV